MVSIPEIDESVQIYEEVVRNLCNLYRELGIDDDPVKIFENFIFMYKNGFLSNNRMFSNTVSDELLKIEGSTDYLPMDITGIILLCGYGVCRHTSDFLSHIYQMLRYDSAQLFTYHPSLNIHVKNYGKEFLTNHEAQKYIDEATLDLDLFSKEEFHFERVFGDIAVRVDYLPERNQLLNHTMNIALDRRGFAHILDTRNHSVGEKIDDAKILLNYRGLTHTDFIQRNLFFNTYYGTNYFKGLDLLGYDSANIDRNILASIIEEEACKKNIECYEEFRLNNEKYYREVTSNMKKLVKRL